MELNIYSHIFTCCFNIIMWRSKIAFLFGIGFLIIAMSIAFYSIIYLPGVGQNQLKLAEQQKMAERIADSETKAERVQQIKTCLAEADSNYTSVRRSACKAEKQEADCSLPGDKAQVIEQYKSEKKTFVLSYTISLWKMHIFYVLFWIALYFVPSIIAATQKKKNGASIFIVNLFFGWTQ